jgi:hypothetical protein
VTLRDASAAPGGPARESSEGLSEAELEAETAQELPDREAMSIVGLPGVGLPGIGMPAPVGLPEADPVDPSILPDES